MCQSSRYGTVGSLSSKIGEARGTTHCFKGADHAWIATCRRCCPYSFDASKDALVARVLHAGEEMPVIEP